MDPRRSRNGGAPGRARRFARGGLGGSGDLRVFGGHRVGGVLPADPAARVLPSVGPLGDGTPRDALRDARRPARRSLRAPVPSRRRLRGRDLASRRALLDRLRDGGRGAAAGVRRPRRRARSRGTPRGAPDRRDGAPGARDAARGLGDPAPRGPGLHAVAVEARGARRAVPLRRLLDSRRSRGVGLGGLSRLLRDALWRRVRRRRPRRDVAHPGAGRALRPGAVSRSERRFRSSSASCPPPGEKRSSWIPLRFPEKFVVAVAFALAILAGLAFDRFRGARRVPSWVLAVAAVLAIAAVAASRFPAGAGRAASAAVGATPEAAGRAGRQVATALAEGGIFWAATWIALELLRGPGRARAGGGRRDPHGDSDRRQPADRARRKRSLGACADRVCAGGRPPRSDGARSGPWTRRFSGRRRR